ncbi:hypothetical protein [Agromyces bauzanensis]
MSTINTEPALRPYTTVHDFERLAAFIPGANVERAVYIYKTCNEAELAVSPRQALMISTPASSSEYRSGDPASVSPVSTELPALRARFRQAEQIATGELRIETLANGARVAVQVRA